MPLPLGVLAALLGAGGATASGIQSGMQGGNFFGGSKGGFSTQPLLDPQQQQLHSQLLQGLGGAQGSGLEWLQNMLSGSPEAMESFEAPYKQQFEQETIPGIAERFGGLGAQSSSAMNQTLGQAGSDLSTQLAALRGSLQQNALSQLQNLLQAAYQPTFQTSYKKPSSGFLGGIGNVLGAGAGSALSKLFGG